MTKDEEINRFQQLMGYAASSGENISAQLQNQRQRLIAVGLTNGEINNLIHDRNNRKAYKPLPAPTETPLNVPFSDKDRAKALGARWNANRKIWVAPAGADLNKFKIWLKHGAKVILR